MIQQINTNQALWAAEQALRSGSCACVLIWPDSISFTQSKRLQLAAEEGQGLVILFRSLQVIGQASVACLRLSIQQQVAGLRVNLLKQRGSSQRPGFVDIIRD